MEATRTLEDAFEQTDAGIEAEGLILRASELVLGLLDNQGVTQSELAGRVGKSKGHVSQLLSGERNMTLRTLSEVLHALGHRIRLHAEPLDAALALPVMNFDRASSGSRDAFFAEAFRGQLLETLHAGKAGTYGPEPSTEDNFALAA